jgi:transposase
VSEVITIGLDIAKHVFHVHGADERGRAVFSKKISRAKLLDFFAAQPSCKVALEACGGAHHWARQLSQLGHEVRLIPPAYVKPFVRRQKNDAIDAEAICEAAQRPSMRFVAVKSQEQQAAGLVFRTRDLSAAANPTDQRDSRTPHGIWLDRSQVAVACSDARGPDR